MPSSHQNYAHQLGQIAAFLNQQQDGILQAWRFAVEQDEQLRIAASLDREQFEGQIPSLFQFLIREIRSEQILQHQYNLAEEASLPKITKKEHGALQQHALCRWQHGYSVEQLILEWAHLNLTLVRILNECEAKGTCIDDSIYNNSTEEDYDQAMATVRLLASQLCDVGYLQSITEFQRLQGNQTKAMMQELSATLQQMMKWEKTRGEVLREAVHDLRGHLTAVQGAASLLDNDGADSQTQRAISHILQRGTGTLYQMLTDLLDLSRLESGHEECQVESFDCALLIQELCEINQPLAQGKGLDLAYVGPTNLEVEGDVLKARRITQNLLLNALKYTEEGGVTIQCIEEGQDHWRLCVRDTGPGFNAPQQTVSNADVAKEERRTTRGEGVGLVIVRRLCELLDSRLEIASTIGQGSSFQVIWPKRYQNDKDQAQCQSAESPSSNSDSGF